MAYKMKGFSGFKPSKNAKKLKKTEGPVRPKSIVSAKQKDINYPYSIMSQAHLGFEEPEKIAYSRRALNPTIKNPK